VRRVMPLDQQRWARVHFLRRRRLGSGLRGFRGRLTSGVALSGHSRGDIYGTLDVLELKKAAHGW
jgi:hypothetical protein